LSTFILTDEVALSLIKREDGIELVITDNDVGLDLNHTLCPAPVLKGLGLASMKERAQLSGGTLFIKSEPDRGTTIRAFWPDEDD
jgi:two-component system NarL family sensor kinase